MSPSENLILVSTCVSSECLSPVSRGCRSPGLNKLFDHTAGTKDFPSDFDHLSVTLSVGATLCPTALPLVRPMDC